MPYEDLPPDVKPTRIARGVDPERSKIRKPSLQELMMDAGENLSGWSEPFHPHNWLQETLDYADVQGRYNSWGNFAVNARSRYSRHRTLHRMRMDTEIIELSNKTRQQK
jgi:hypothetical protein